MRSVRPCYGPLFPARAKRAKGKGDHNMGAEERERGDRPINFEPSRARTRIARLRYSFLRFPPIRATKPEVPRQLGKFGSNERGARRLAIVWQQRRALVRVSNSIDGAVAWAPQALLLRRET